jgi:S1-C subfamily serine protease
MRARSFHISAWFVVACAVLASSMVWGASDPAPPAQAAIDALIRANAAVVGVDVRATDDARSAQSLGDHRVGSGVVIGNDGLILTIGYLMLEADTIQIITHDHRTLPARAVGYDIATGFGLVKSLLPLRIAPAPLGRLQELNPGDAVMAATGGEDSDVAITRLVSKRPFSGYWEYHIDAALFTSPPIGNHSGAALFNRRGELLGIGSLFVANSMGEGHGIVPGNMFVPVDLLRPILGELQRTGTTAQSRRPWLGLTSSEQGGRVQVVRVTKDSPAELAGIERGDVVLAVDDAPVATLEEFYKRIWAHAKPDDIIKLTILQGDESKVLAVKGIDRMTTMAKPRGI